jgi:putative DNA primase/helicase
VLATGSDRKKVQEFAGYLLHHWDLPYHKALFLVGPTASGKSTLLDTLRSMLGSDSVASLTPQQMAGEKFGGAELRGAWANIRNDIPANTIENVGQLKEIVGGDPIKAERKHQDPFMFEPTAKHAFSANQLPDAEVSDEAFFRRILLVPVPDTVPRGERDAKLDDKLQDELPGILNWALDGLDRLLAQGRFTADRTPGETQRTWEKWGHSITRFVEDCLDETAGNAIPKSDLYAAYVAFCEDEGIPKDTQHKMTRQLKMSGLEDGREYVDGTQQRCILGIDWSGRGEEYAPEQTGSRPSGLDDH